MLWSLSVISQNFIALNGSIIFFLQLEIWKSTVYEWDTVDVFVCVVLSWESECFLFICDAVIISSSTHTLSISLGCLPLTVMSTHTQRCVCVSNVKCYLTDGNMLRSLTLCHCVCVSSRAGISEMFEGHHGPITGIHCHTATGPVDFSHLFLTASFDWTVKLWSSKVTNHSYTLITLHCHSWISQLTVFLSLL